MLKRSLRVAAIGMALVAVQGCGGSSHGSSDRADPGAEGDVLPAGGLPYAMSGQRLEAWFLVASSSQIFDSFHDRQLATDCTFAPLGTGDRYACFPNASADLVYLDDHCHDAALRFDSLGSASPPSWVSSSVTASGPRRVGYRVGELVFAGGLPAEHDPPAVFVESDSGCQPSNLRDGLLPPSLYRLEPQDDATFVPAALAPLRLSEDFTLQRLRADDGAELTLGVLGRDGQACEPQTDGVCVPSPFSVLPTASGAGLFLDAGCGQPAFPPVQELAVPKLGLDRSSGSSKVFELVATPVFSKLERLDATTGARLFDADGHVTFECQADARIAAWAPGRERTASLGVAGQLAASFGDLRWVQQRAPGSDGAALTPFEPGGAFFDEQGLACRARATFDHQLGCAVDGAEVFASGVFSDSACEHGLYDMVAASEATPAAIARLRAIDGRNSETQNLLSFSNYSGPTFRVLSQQCEPLAATSSLLQVARVLPLPRFKRLSR